MYGTPEKNLSFPHKIIKASVFSSAIFCVLVFSMALYAFFYVPRSTLMSSEMLVWRMGSGIISYFLAAGFVFCAKIFFQSRISEWVSVPLLGSAILFLSFFSFIFIGDYFGKINCAQEIRFGACNLLDREQTVLTAVSAFILSSVISGVVYFIVDYLYKTFSKRSIVR